MAKSFERLSLKRPCPVALPTLSADQRVAWCAHCGQDVRLGAGTWWVEVEGQREVFEMGSDIGVIGVVYVPS